MSFRSEQVPGKVEQHLYACPQCGASNGKNAERCWHCESRLPPPLFDELRDPAPTVGAAAQQSVQAAAKPAETDLWRSEAFSADSAPETASGLPTDTPLKFDDPTERFSVAANGPSMQFETTRHPRTALEPFRGDASGRLEATTTTLTPAMGRLALTAALATLVGAAFIGQRIYGSRTPDDHLQGKSRDAATQVSDAVLSGSSEAGSPVSAAPGIAPSDAVAGNAATAGNASAKAPSRTKTDPGFSRGLSAATSAQSPATLPVAVTPRSSPPVPRLPTSSAPLDTRASDTTSTASDLVAAPPVGMTPADIVVPPPVAARPALLEASGAVGVDRRRRGETPPTPARATVCSEAIQALGLCGPTSSPPKE